MSKKPTEAERIIISNQALIMRGLALLHLNAGGPGSGFMASRLKERAIVQDDWLGHTNLDDWGNRL